MLGALPDVIKMPVNGYKISHIHNAINIKVNSYHIHAFLYRIIAFS
jgi:hypothetical protein